MRTAFALALAIVLPACTEGGEGDDGDGDGGTPDEPELRLESPEIDIQPGQEITYCWYFRTQNTKPLAIKHWQSTMSPGSHHLIMFTTMNDVMPPGMVSTIDCGAGNSFPIWTYSAQTSESELRLPTDDGEGNPVAIEIGANQSGFIQMHYNNRSDAVIKARVLVTGQALEEGTAFTKTAAYVTYNGNIAVPAMTNGHVEVETCNVPPTSKFWLMSTHSHKQSVRTAIRDGMPTSQSMMFESNDWEHPGASRWEAPFRTFASGKLTYECEYNNPTNRTITDGDSAQTDEMCMASGYFFPATKPTFCYTNIVF